jgi:hypothetical protein
MIGAPGSLARFKEEHPQDWQFIIGEEEDLLDRLVSGSLPTHRLPAWLGKASLLEPPSSHLPAWELGEANVDGRRRFYYVTRQKMNGPDNPATLEVLYDVCCLAPILYSKGEGIVPK